MRADAGGQAVQQEGLSVAIPHQAFDAVLLGARERSPMAVEKTVRALEAGLFRQQRDVDRDPARRKAVLCTRRAGKTHRIAVRRLVCMLTRPGQNSWSGYVTLTKAQSRRNLEGPLNTLIQQHRLPVSVSEQDGQLTYTHNGNGHRLWIGGVDDVRKAERWRGNKWWEFEIDEGGAWPDAVLEYMIESIIEPGLSDTRGSIILNGTPGVLANGFFWEVTTPGTRKPDGTKKRAPWAIHSWSVLDNPHHAYGQPGGREELEQYRLSKGWSEDHPTWLREWCGKWASDPDMLIYRFNAERSAFWEFPDARGWRFVLGVDLGHNDDTAFVLTASQPGFPAVYVLRAWGAPALTQPQRAQEILRVQAALRERHNTEASVVVDIGGLGKAMAEDLRRTYGVSCKPAEKRDKAAAIRAVQAALDAGHMRICPFAPSPDDPIGLGCAQLLGEWSVLPWDDDRTGHRDGYADHCADATLYAYREHPGWERWEEEPPTPGTAAAIDHAMERRIEREMREGELQNLMRGADPLDQLDYLDELRELQ